MNKSLATNAVYKVLLNVFNLLVPLFVGPYVAGLLNPDLYGMYNRVFAEFQIFFIIGGFGIYYYGIREISKVRNDPKKFSEVFTSLFVIGILSNLLVTLIYVAYFLIRGNGMDQIVYAIMILQMISNVFYIEFVNEAVENYRFIALKTIIIRILYLVGIFAFVRKPDDVIIYSIVICMTVLLNNLASFFYLKRQYKFHFKNIKILCHIFPLIVNLLFVNVEMLYGQLDKVMLGAFISDISVTEYTLPTTLVGMICTIPLSLVTVAIPRLSGYLGEGDHDKYIDTLKNTNRVYMALLIPITFGLLVLAKEVMWLYSKDVYTYAYPVLAAAAVSRIIYGYESVMTYLVMYVNGLEKQLTLFLLYGGIINLVLNFALVAVGWFTAATAVLTTTLSVLVFIVIANLYIKKHLGVTGLFFPKEIRRYYYVAATFIPVSIVVNLLDLGFIFNIIIEMAVCMGIYGGYMLLSKDPLTEVVLKKLPFGKK